jgi:glucose/arabinose dehydrogenase
VRVYQNKALLGTPALNLSAKICTNSERGVLGIAVDPNFTTNQFIYLYYTFNKPGNCNNSTVNRVARFVLSANNIVDPASETVLIDNIHSPAGNHNGGDLHFGKDDLLYVSVGDGGCDYAGNSGCAGSNDAARDRHVMLGKILRITRDGAVPEGNPYQGANSGRCSVTGSTTAGNWCQETFASGLRNPFRIAFDSNALNTRFFINDVGQGVWEEIDEGIAGADYGWNIREGHCANNSTTNCSSQPTVTVNNEVFTNPIFDYQHTSNCSAAGVRGNSITGGAFVPNGVWSVGYDNSYLVGEYVCGKIFKLTPNGSGGYAASEFATGLGGSSAVAMIFGPFQTTKALYYTTYAGGGQIRRISYTGAANRNPAASFTATPTSGVAPLDVTFNAAASSDPDNDALSFNWNFGDGNTGTGVSPAHRYTANGTYNAVLTVSDGRGGSGTANVSIDVGNTAPQPTITAPTSNKLFRVGETITLQGTATDAQDGTLANNRLTWEVILHHNNDHTHPFLSPTVGNNITFTAPAPEDLVAAVGSYLEIRLTATDSQGLSSTITQNLQPRKVNITLATNPSGLNLAVNGANVTASHTFVSWDGYDLNVNAPNQTANGQQFVFQSWSDGGGANHTITTPATATTFTATFRATQTISGSISYGITAAGQPAQTVSGVNLNASGATAVSAVSDAAGNYQLSGLTSGGSYTVAPSKQAQSDASGINSLDATRIQQYLVGLITLTPNQLIAADTDGNGTVNSLDATRIQQRLVGIQTNNIIGQWKFLPASKQYNAVNRQSYG